jgi:hypothetical protein
MSPSSVIRKHTLHFASSRVLFVDVPVGSQPLSAALQPTNDGGAQIVLWTVGPEHAPMTKRRVVLVATGHDIGSDIISQSEFVSTIQWMAPRRASDGTVTAKAMVEHVWLEREPLN